MYKLRDYQQEAVDAVFDYFYTHKTGNPLIEVPTAGGKSLIIADICKRIITQWPGTKILNLTHVKELIGQNHQKITEYWPESNAGIYSAGFNRRETENSIIFAGIQSIHKKPREIGRVDLVLIDECHLVPTKTADGTYRTFIDALLSINPKLRIVGFTATPYRLDSGLLIEGKNRIFTDIAYSVPMQLLIDRKYLCPLITAGTEAKADLSSVKERMGDFVPGQLQNAFDQDWLTEMAVEEMRQIAKDRRKWLIFTTGEDHVKHVTNELIKNGITAEYITGKTKKADREAILKAYKHGEFQALLNINVLSTGFDEPGIDFLGFLMGTKSCNKWVQACGRGMRPLLNDKHEWLTYSDGSYVKENCLVADFGGNIEQLGPVDKCRPKPKRTNDRGIKQGAPVKSCPVCGEPCTLKEKECPNCSHEFIVGGPSHEHTASTMAIMSYQEGMKPANKMIVLQTFYSRHVTSKGSVSLCVTYANGNKKVKEWIPLENEILAVRGKAAKWWRDRCPNIMVPYTVDNALELAHLLIEPVHIWVDRNGQYPKIVNQELGDLSIKNDRIAGSLGYSKY